MYSIVLMAAMTAGPDVPQNWMCPVTQPKDCSFWSTHCFYDCCAPARYGWVTCWSKGYGYYPGNSRGFCGGCGCSPSYGHFYNPGPCACQCGPCAGYGGGHGGGHSWCGCGWSIGDQPAYYSSVLGCPPCLTAPPYACGTDCNPCCHAASLAFDTGLAGHSHGVGYAGFGGYGNFGFYGAMPMMHRPTTNDLPPFPRRDFGPSSLPVTPAPMPPLPKGVIPEPRVPEVPDDAKKTNPMKEEPKKDKPQVQRAAPATVVLSVPEGATVTVEGQPLLTSGRERKFRTPNLPPDQEFAYSVRAAITVAGREEVETIQVKVVAGEISRASFEKLFARLELAGKNLADAKSQR